MEHRSQSKWRALAVLLVVLAVALLLTGCITGITLTSPTEAGPHYTVVVNMSASHATDPGTYEGTIAVRLPAGWEVVSAEFATSDGAAAPLTYSPLISNYFYTAWQAKPIDASHNGPKAGYGWSGYYSELIAYTPDTTMTATFVIDTHGISAVAPYLLDFVTGLTDPAFPTDSAKNGDGANWELGGTWYTTPPYGVRLDVAATVTPQSFPTVLAVTPNPGTTGVSVDTGVLVTFSEDMDAASLAEAKAYITPEGGVPVVAANTYNSTTHQLTIDPTAALAPDTAYTLTVKSTASDAVGNLMGADYVSTFRTAPALPVPALSTTSPLDLATGVSVTPTVTATFTIPMDASTITSSTFRLWAAPLAPTSAGDRQPAALPPLPTTVTYDAVTRTATLTPTVKLAHATRYMAGLNTDVKSADGVPLAAITTWSFTTQEAPAFSDVPPSNPYYEAIQGMAGLGVINGYDDGTFRPDFLVWRQHFAKMICGALGLTVTEGMNSPFTDLPSPNDPTDRYPNDFIAAAWQQGITQGITPTTFGPENNIRRAQVVTMVVRALQNLHPGLLAVPPADYVNTWGTGFDATHGPLARIAEYNHLLDGLDLHGASADPMGLMSRGETAQVLWNMMGLL